jgi:phosphomannomutase
MNAKIPLRISQFGLRGVVGAGLTPTHVLDFSAAFATLLGQPSKVIIGRDPRASGQMIREGVASALMACGHDVIDLGIVSTPVIQHAITATGARGGISIGASHMAAEWNALKFFGERGSYLSTAEAGELLDIYHLKGFDFARHQPLHRQPRPRLRPPRARPVPRPRRLLQRHLRPHPLHPPRPVRPRPRPHQ